jgi:hypothetical protein
MPTTVDRLAMGTSGALLLLGVVVLGAVETFDGPPYGAAPTTNEAGEVLAQPTVDPAIRTGLVVAALLVLLLWGGYRLVVPERPASATAADARPADDG